MTNDVAPPLAAPQHERAPRPLPLFLEMVRRQAETDIRLAGDALRGLRLYQNAEREVAARQRPMVAAYGGAALRDCGGNGPPIVLVPSLINPPHILDLDAETSLAERVTAAGRVLLLDWGKAEDRRGLSCSDHITQRLLPLIGGLGCAPALVGYCLGGTMALAAATQMRVRGVATLASPWLFSGYPAEARAALERIWRDAHPAASLLGLLPIEVLQASFWSIDPHAVVSKFARLADLSSDDQALRRFLLLEDWANSGEALPLPAARELMEDLFAKDLPGSGLWLGRGLPRCPTLHFVAASDRIVPAATAAPGEQVRCPAGHVGMVVGRRAAEHLHRPLCEWLARLPQHG